jgi:hypothetical protein
MLFEITVAQPEWLHSAAGDSFWPWQRNGPQWL